jgi:hypothetical protein
MESERIKLKNKFLSDATTDHKKFLETQDKKYWNDMLENQWRASCVDDLDDEFFKVRVVEKVNSIKEMKERLVELRKQYSEYAQKLLEEKLKKNMNMVYWYEACIERVKKEGVDISKKLKRVHKQEDRSEIERAKMYPISQVIKANRAGFALCPFHGERTPSLKLYEETNTFHCFGCSESGDVVKLYMQVNGVDFPSAIKNLI